ncbi:ABC transporter ATP-binding protein [bacterium]|nr:ABC transporter ATP-binding protein [bacterium]
MTVPDIELKDVRFSYNGEAVLKDINLSVDRNDFLAVIGPNGGGKTTLLKLILGIHAPDRGIIRVFGDEPARAATRIGYVAQDTSFNREFPITVLDVTLMGRLAHNTSLRRFTREDVKIAQRALETVDIAEYSGKRIGTLSSGQRQRVFIARALATESDILILDEPTASIDMEGQSKIYEILKELNRSMTIIVVSHDYALTLGFAKTVAHVNRTLHVHKSLDFTPEMIKKLSESSLRHICPVELITQGYFRMGNHVQEEKNVD